MYQTSTAGAEPAPPVCRKNAFQTAAEISLIGRIEEGPWRCGPGADAVRFIVRTCRTDGKNRSASDLYLCIVEDRLAGICLDMLSEGNRVFVRGNLCPEAGEQEGSTWLFVLADVVLRMPRLTQGKPKDVWRIEHAKSCNQSTCI